MLFYPTTWVIFIIVCLRISGGKAAIAPPPWSDPNKNPCATMPGGWQLLYWTPLKQCFKIFQLGYPCPESMELSPAGGGMAECRCPPGTAQSAKTTRCHTIFERGPCDEGEYFGPLQEPPVKSIRPKQRWGICKAPEKCSDGMIFWPKDAKCYGLFTRGPCARGKLLVHGQGNIAECDVSL